MPFAGQVHEHFVKYALQGCTLEVSPIFYTSYSVTRPKASAIEQIDKITYIYLVICSNGIIYGLCRSIIVAAVRDKYKHPTVLRHTSGCAFIKQNLKIWLNVQFWADGDQSQTAYEMNLM